MIGTLKVYVRMYSLRLRRAVRRHQNRRFLSTPSSAWVVTLDSSRNGLFAHLGWCLAIWARAEKYGCRVSLRAISPQYGRSDLSVDWFEALFLNNFSADGKDSKIAVEITEYEEWVDYQRRDGLADIAEASRLFYRYSGVQPAIVADVDRYCVKHWGTDPVLGVHYRGTDKKLEAPPVSFDTMINYVREALTLWPELRTVFVATDEEDFPNCIRTAFPEHRVVFVGEALRSRNALAIHHLNIPDGLQRARQAVFDCLVLSRTSFLIKTASMLSGWSVILSPALPAILVNPPHRRADFFPDCVLDGRVSDLPSRIAVARANHQAASISRENMAERTAMKEGAGE